jgi:hypothetical protein
LSIASGYPALTADELNQRGVFDDRILDFLSCSHVQFIPFSSGDPDNKIILRIDAHWVDGTQPLPGQSSYLVLMKKQATKPQEQ